MMRNNDIRLFPGDYEACGECGFDHRYEQAAATAYHRLEAEETARKEKNDKDTQVEPHEAGAQQDGDSDGGGGKHPHASFSSTA